MRINRNELNHAVDIVQKFAGRTTDVSYRFLTIQPMKDKTMFFGSDGFAYIWVLSDVQSDMPVIHVDLDSFGTLVKVFNKPDVELEVEDNQLLMRTEQEEVKLQMKEEHDQYFVEIPDEINCYCNTSSFIHSLDIGSLCSDKDAADEIGILSMIGNNSISFLASTGYTSSFSRVMADVKKNIAFAMNYHTARHVLKALKKMKNKKSLQIRMDNNFIYIMCSDMGIMIKRYETKDDVMKELKRRVDMIREGNQKIRNQENGIEINGVQLNIAIEQADQLERKAHGDSWLVAEEGKLFLNTANSAYDKTFTISDIPAHESFDFPIQAREIKSFIRRTLKDKYTIWNENNRLWIVPSDTEHALVLEKEE